MSILSKIGANVASKFAEALKNNIRSSIANINRSSVGASINNSGISHATDIKQRLSQIEWSRGYSWDVYIDPAPPAPFDKTSFGLPVVNVQSDFALVGSSGTLELANAVYNFPNNKSFFQISLTLLDDEIGTMEQYFEEWTNQVYSWNDDTRLRGTINYLEDSVRQIRLTKLNSKKQEIFTRSYLVYPEAQMASFDNSEGTVRNFQINLVVAGYLGKTTTKSVVETSVSARIV